MIYIIFFSFLNPSLFTYIQWKLLTEVESNVINILINKSLIFAPIIIVSDLSVQIVSKFILNLIVNNKYNHGKIVLIKHRKILEIP